MADEQNGWLDRETAERLLTGEPSGVADPVARDQAERLADALGALAAPPPPPGGELPGEAAALAAFRAARAERGERTASGARDGEPAATAVADGGLVRLGGPAPHPSGTARGLRRARYLRFGLAAALTAGMVGGAAYLAGTGAQSGHSGEPVGDPGASVTASVPPPGPLVSPAPSEGAGDRAAPGGAPDDAPDRAPGAGTAPDGPRAQGDEDTGHPRTPGPDATRPGGHESGWKHVVAACRALRDGKDPGGSHKRRLDALAGGSARVRAYCKGILAAADDPGAARKGGGRGGSSHGDDRRGDGPQRGGGEKNGKGGGDQGKGGRNGRSGAEGGANGRGDDRPGRSGRQHARGPLVAATATVPVTVAFAGAPR
ncbi:hypothetical protein [Streptomyces sp. enrichment culture]|uniref:hypothetical protein n=1 Tax=Streptomyces sp. enrichment culture TaxID=1795815 RepID=UPI003F56D6E1